MKIVNNPRQEHDESNVYMNYNCPVYYDVSLRLSRSHEYGYNQDSPVIEKLKYLCQK